jgi:hypothetical protein
MIVLREDHNGTLLRSDARLWIDGRQIVQVLPAATGERPVSNWPFLHRSALVKRILPDFVMSAAMSNLADTPAPPLRTVPGGLSLDEVEPAGEGGTIERGRPLQITTAAHSGYFAAAFPLKAPAELFGARYAFLRARVLHGRIGVGVTDAKTKFLIQRTIDPSPDMQDIYLPVIESQLAVHLIIYNAAGAEVPSAIRIEDAALVAPGSPQ